MFCGLIRLVNSSKLIFFEFFALRLLSELSFLAELVGVAGASLTLFLCGDCDGSSKFICDTGWFDWFVLWARTDWGRL